ncbi:MobV family relaxase [Vagococcus lutrae]|uniref:MobV family relaxase n=1 Tax=Vagococcus lutrae TaxID=81947 RepID=UPI00288C9564|nr:MobV family relaxase [Vagococcus lutrae]MDT2813214.1 MobV family relaxase [Vagococcus lutrae]
MSESVSMIVARMQKMKAGNLTGSQKHNQREFKNHSNEDIDQDREHLNYDLVNDTPINYQEKVKEIIESQRESTRAIRKDAVLVNEWIITSNQLFFEDMDQETLNLFFETALDYFSSKFGSQNMAYAQVHLDETTPHMHLGIVPMSDGKLSSKTVFNRQTLREIQDELPKVLKENGFEIERGHENSERKNLSVATYKEVVNEAKKKAELEVQEITKELKSVTKERQSELKKLNTSKQQLEEKNKQLQGKVADIYNIYKLDYGFDQFERNLERTMFGKRIINETELRKLQKTFNGLRSKAIELKDKSDKQARINEQLSDKLKKVERDFKIASERREELNQENKTLARQLSSLKEKNTVYRDILKHDYSLNGISQREFDARLVLNDIESGYKPPNRRTGELWVETLENATDTKIEPSRLDRGLKLAKAMLQKLIELARRRDRDIER